MKRFIADWSVDVCARLGWAGLMKLMLRLNEIQLTAAEIRPIVTAVKTKAPCNFLVFGVGNDSRFWRKINHRGRTVFIEDDARWLSQARESDAHMVGHLVDYSTVRTQWQELLDQPARLSMELPGEIQNQKWDVILVDAPNGYDDKTPGRMKSIFKAAQLAADGADVFVHDCHREVERAYCDRFLGIENLQGEIHWLRHYRLFGRN